MDIKPEWEISHLASRNGGCWDAVGRESYLAIKLAVPFGEDSFKRGPKEAVRMGHWSQLGRHHFNKHLSRADIIAITHLIGCFSGACNELPSHCRPPVNCLSLIGRISSGDCKECSIVNLHWREHPSAFAQSPYIISLEK